MLVDAYRVPACEAEAYRARREQLAQAARAHFRAAGCAAVQRCWAGSEDGEAVVGLDENGALLCLVHLDPTSTEAFLAARAAGCEPSFWKEHGC